MFSVHCLEQLVLPSCTSCGCRRRRRRRDSNSSSSSSNNNAAASKKSAPAQAAPAAAVVVNVSHAAASAAAAASQTRRRPSATASSTHRRLQQRHLKRRHARLHSGRVEKFSVSSSSSGGSGSGSNSSDERYRRPSGDSSAYVRETLAMVNAVDRWLACPAQGGIDFSMPLDPALLVGTCLVNMQRIVLSVTGKFVSMLARARAAHNYNTFNSNTHNNSNHSNNSNNSNSVNTVFDTRFAQLIISLADKCASDKSVAALRMVHERLPYNIIAYPQLVRGTVEGVLLMWRSDQAPVAELNDLIVSAPTI